MDKDLINKIRMNSKRSKNSKASTSQCFFKPGQGNEDRKEEAGDQSTNMFYLRTQVIANAQNHSDEERKQGSHQHLQYKHPNRPEQEVSFESKLSDW